MPATLNVGSRIAPVNADRHPKAAQTVDATLNRVPADTRVLRGEPEHMCRAIAPSSLKWSRKTA